MCSGGDQRAVRSKLNPEIQSSRVQEKIISIISTQTGRRKIQNKFQVSKLIRQPFIKQTTVFMQHLF